MALLEQRDREIGTRAASPVHPEVEYREGSLVQSPRPKPMHQMCAAPRGGTIWGYHCGGVGVREKNRNFLVVTPPPKGWADRIRPSLHSYGVPHPCNTRNMGQWRAPYLWEFMLILR